MYYLYTGNKRRYMIVTFEKEYLRDFYEIGKTTDKKHRFQPDVIEGYVKGIYIGIVESL